MWVVKEQNKRKLEVEVDVRRSLRISKCDTNSNEEVRRKMDIERTFFQDIERNQ